MGQGYHSDCWWYIVYLAGPAVCCFVYIVIREVCCDGLVVYVVCDVG